MGELTNVLGILAASLQFGSVVRDGKFFFLPGTTSSVTKGEEQLIAISDCVFSGRDKNFTLGR